MTTSINMLAVEALVNHYHKKVKTNPNLYTNSRDRDHAVLVVLPKELLDYANRGAGHSGFGAGARPVGIRRVVSNARGYLKEIFGSKESLRQFIESSECDADEYIAEVRSKHLQKGQETKVKPVKAVMTKDEKNGFWSHYTKEDLAMLVVKFGRTVVQNAYNGLTLTEFEAQFDLKKELTTA